MQNWHWHTNENLNVAYLSAAKRVLFENVSKKYMSIWSLFRHTVDLINVTRIIVHFMHIFWVLNYICSKTKKQHSLILKFFRFFFFYKNGSFALSFKYFGSLITREDLKTVKTQITILRRQYAYLNFHFMLVKKLRSKIMFDTLRVM